MICFYFMVFFTQGTIQSHVDFILQQTSIKFAKTERQKNSFENN